MIIGPWPVPSTNCSAPVNLLNMLRDLDDDDDCDYDTESENKFT